MEKGYLVELRNGFFEVEAMVKAETSFLGTLERRISENAIKVNGMDQEILEMVQVRGVILRQMSRGEKDDADLKAQDEKIAELKKSRERLGDLLDSDRRELIETDVKVQKLAKDLAGKKHELWFNVSLLESEKIREANFLPVLRAWAAFVQSGAPANLGHWLAGHFNNFGLDLTQVTKDLEKEYLLTPSQRGGK